MSHSPAPTAIDPASASPGSTRTVTLPSDTTISTNRLTLTALVVDDAEEMVRVLDDERLHEFIGGRPATLDELRDRYRRLVAGPPIPDQRWLNWIVRRGYDQVPIGTLQTTIFLAEGDMTSAEVAWVINPSWQGQRYATEAARAVVAGLRRHGVTRLCARIHPGNRASAVVAGRVGLRPTSDDHEEETVWRADNYSTLHVGSSAPEDQTQ